MTANKNTNTTNREIIINQKKYQNLNLKIMLIRIYNLNTIKYTKILIKY